VHAWHELDLAASVGTTTVDGVEAGRGRGADVMGNPLEALAWLANALADDGEVNPCCIAFLNRLSDLLFVIARTLANASDQGEILWDRKR